MYFDSTVKIPSEKGKIITKKKGSATYILYQYGQDYNAEKQYSVPKRAIIGKVNTEDSTTMFPNERFQEFFPDVQLADELPEAYRSCAMRLGSYAVIQKIIQEYKLQAKLSKWFGKDCGLLFDLVTYLIVNEENAGQYYPDFAFNHPLFSENMHIYSDSKVCRFLKSITKEQMIGFLDDWNEARDHKQRIYISYDSTNKNCQAGDIDIIEYGKAKDDKGVPVFNVAVAFDTTNRVPLFYEEYPGSITDVSQFVYMVDKVNQYKYKKIGFILDRGYFSKDNIRYMEENNYSFIIMMKGQKKLAADLIKVYRNTFETNRDCNIRLYRVYGKTIEAKLYADDTCKRFFHLYFNSSRQAKEREQLEQYIDRMKMFLDKHKGQQIVLPAVYNDFFNIRYTKQKELLSYSEKKEFIEEQLELCGYFCIITFEKMTAAEALIHYKGRDISEKLFCSDKSFIGAKSMRVQSNEALSAKLFIEFIALIIRNRIYNLLKENMLRLETKPNFMTVPAALRELEKIEMVRRSNGSYKLDHAVSKRQKTILSAFGMDTESIRTLAAEVDKLLSTSQSLMQVENEEEAEDAENTFDIYN